MNKNMNLPAEYAVLSEEEMTYTQGGSDIGGFATTAATVVGAVVLGASYIWGISASKDWLNKKSNREGNLFTVLGRAADAVSGGRDRAPSQPDKAPWGRSCLVAASSPQIRRRLSARRPNVRAIEFRARARDPQENSQAGSIHRLIHTCCETRAP